MNDARGQEETALSSQEKSIKAKVYWLWAGLLVVMGLGIAAVFWFVEAEKQRDIQILQSRLNVVADSRAQAARTWLARQYSVLGGLARNESLQLYTAVLQGGDDDQASDEALAHATYLRTLLQATAARTGFQPDDDAALPANVRATGTSGIALVDPGGEIIVATPNMPPIHGRLRAFLTDHPMSERGMTRMHVGPDGVPRLGLVVPVVSPIGADLTPTVIARVFGVRPVGDAFLDSLIQPGETARTAESYLIQRDGNVIQYLTPLRDGSQPLEKVLAVNTQHLIDAEALAEPGRFHAGRDYAAEPAFAVSRPIPGTDWVLVHRIARSEALAKSAARRATLMTVLILGVLLVGAALIAVWRYGASLRAEEAALRFRASSERFEALSEFLDVVADSQPHPLFVTGPDNTLTFGNDHAGAMMGVPKAELPGRPLLAMLGRDRGEVYTAINGAVLESGGARRELHVFKGDDGQDVTWRSYHCPLTTGEGRTPAVLTSIEDLTELFRERARREQTTRQLIETLVGLVDERDPDSADQSRHVARVARAIAAEMGLDPVMVETTGQAASLVNIGKIRVPRTLLTKQGRLSDDEIQLVREALDSGPDMLKGIQFDGPVLETLRQINERVDGTGRPRGLTGDDILDSAQAVALANTFVALISPRAFREGRSFDEAEDLLMNEVGQRFGRRCVLSLLNYLNNKGGRAAWSHMATHAET